MYLLKKGDSLQIAKKLIQSTGLAESLALLKEKNHAGAVERRELLKQVLALSTCNLVQTMKEGFILNEIVGEDQQDIIDDYVVESLRRQDLVLTADGAERMELCQEVESLSWKLQDFWKNEEDYKGPGPRYFCVKEVLTNLGDEKNFDLHDALFEFMYTQHLHFINFFKDLFKPPQLPGALISFGSSPTK
jgi:hypothetical protein